MRNIPTSAARTLVALLLFAGVGCRRRQEVRRIPSPDGARDAIVYATRYGRLAEQRTEIAIRPHGARASFVFSASSGPGEGVRDPTTSVEWVLPTVLRVRYDSLALVFRQDTAAGPMRVRYERLLPRWPRDVEVAGCWTVAAADGRPRPEYGLPAEIALDSVRRSEPDYPGYPLRPTEPAWEMVGWSPRPPDSIGVGISDGFSGIGVGLRLDDDVLRGTARRFSDVGPPLDYGPSIDVVARRLPCSLDSVRPASAPPEVPRQHERR